MTTRLFPTAHRRWLVVGLAVFALLAGAYLWSRSHDQRPTATFGTCKYGAQWLEVSEGSHHYWALGSGDLARFDGRKGELKSSGEGSYVFVADNGDSIAVAGFTDMPCGLE